MILGGKKNKGRKARMKQIVRNNLYKNKEATHRENEMMLKKLERGRKRTSESDKNQALAKLAGIDIPSTSEPPPYKRKQNSRQRAKEKGNLPKGSSINDVTPEGEGPRFKMR